MRGSLLIAGTTSDAGKTLVTTALCRSLARREVRVAPFKAQNMSNNSMVTVDGAEIGRAQWIQARAAGAEPEAAMNPVLLKPGSDLTSHVVVMGEPAGRLDAGEFSRGRDHLRAAAFDAYDDLVARYDVVICEGAGGAAEINLRDRDFVNLGLARHGRMPAIVVGDIDRGGVFASLFGSLALLDAADQALIAGFVINKFRGDVTLLQPGVDRLHALTGRPVLGVLPWVRDVWLDSEDSLAVDGAATATTSVDRALRVVVVRLPRISNFTDVDALALEPGVDLSFTDTPRAVAAADLVVIPGTRSTLADLAWLRDRGLADAIVRHASGGGAVLGICGGFQLLGHRIDDPDGVEGAPGSSVAGLGLLDAATTFTQEKVTRLVSGHALGVEVTGYEIHHGRVRVQSGDPFPGGTRSHAVAGTMWHGSLESDVYREQFLAQTAASAGVAYSPGAVSFEAARQGRLDRLADMVDEHLDMDLIADRITHGAPPGQPVLTSALR